MVHWSLWADDGWSQAVVVWQRKQEAEVKDNQDGLMTRDARLGECCGDTAKG